MEEKDIYNKIGRSEEIAKSIVDIMNLDDEGDTSQFERWSKDNQYAEKVISNLSDKKWLKGEVEQFDRSERTIGSKRLSNHIAATNRWSSLKRIISVGVAAAVIALSFLIIDYSAFLSSDSAEVPIPNTNFIAHKPTLITSKGRVAVVSDEGKEEWSIDIDRLTNEATEISDVAIAQSKYSKFVVPARYWSTIELSDGTVVHINANSELEFPEIFEGDSREVRLKGEGYFDVTKSDKPFIVEANGVKVQVLGTEFNVNARDSSIVKTVLVEGAVAISVDNGKPTILKPNQMAVVDTKSNICEVQQVEVEHHLDWLNGVLKVRFGEMVDAITEIEQWYGVNFEYDSAKLKGVMVTFSIDRSEPIEEVIKILERVSGYNIITKSKSAYEIE